MYQAFSRGSPKAKAQGYPDRMRASYVTVTCDDMRIMEARGGPWLGGLEALQRTLYGKAVPPSIGYVCRFASPPAHSGRPLA